MKKLSLFIILLVATFNLALARPATPKPLYIQQSDNTTLTLHLRGDEFCHYYSTMDNVPVIQKDDNCFYYAKIENGAMVASDLLAHNPDMRAKDEIVFIEDNRYKVQDQLDLLRNSSLQARANAPLRTNTMANTTATNTTEERFNHMGQKKMLIILVEFPDKAMKHTQEQIEQQYNQIGYCQNGHYGSVHDYFFDQSYGNLDLTFDVVGPFVTKEKMKHYGQNDWFGNDKYIGELVTEAVLQADEYVDFNDYDWDEDGEVDQIFITYAGYGESSGASANTIWPHQYYLSYCKLNGDGEGPVVLDGVMIDKYACANELSGTSGSNLDGIGAFCHEFSHCLGLPDFYDTKTNSAFGMSFWDVMDAGNYNGPAQNGEVPTGYSAYERWKCGWLDYMELELATHIDAMPCIIDVPLAYIIRCDNTDNEYLLLENRQNRDWFTYVGYSVDCHGLLVTHVDYKKSFWDDNSVNNNAKHQRMSFIPADNNFSYYTAEALEGDLFPGLLNVTELTPQSHTKTGGMWFSGSSKPKLEFDTYLLNITEEDEHISFDFYHDIVVPTPSIISAKAESESSIKIKWIPQNKAEFYEVEISEDLTAQETDPDDEKDDDSDADTDDTVNNTDADYDNASDTDNDADADDADSDTDAYNDADNDADADVDNDIDADADTGNSNENIETPSEESEPAFIQTKTITEGNECVFEDLAPANYKLRIRSSYLEKYSEWTDYVYVTVTKPDGILTIQADGEAPYSIYTLQGIRVSQIKSSGIYLFRYPNRTEKRYVNCYDRP